MFGNPWGNDTTMPLLKAAMDVSALRHEVVSSNIANIDTPGYKAQEINFKELLREYSDTLDTPVEPASHLRPAPILNLQNAIFKDDNQNLVERFDGNNVDIDHEMGKMSANSGMFSLARGFMDVKLRLLHEAIK